jgi:hypothetical protein
MLDGRDCGEQPRPFLRVVFRTLKPEPEFEAGVARKKNR